jgi:hypothetical protein
MVVFAAVVGNVRVATTLRSCVQLRASGIARRRTEEKRAEAFFLRERRRRRRIQSAMREQL